jgi:hypothetical protein
MKANELRIGNLLMQGQVGALDNSQAWTFKDGVVLPIKYQDCEPIILTKDWLKKFGFKKNIDTSYSRNDISLFIDKRLKTNLFLQENMNDFKWFGYECKIQYVHQLQNLYHSLTQDEL